MALQLPGLTCKCFHTGRDNFFAVQFADEQGNKIDYEIYFTVSRSSQKGILNLFIQSAYARDVAYRPFRPKVNHWNRIGFGIILYNTLNKIPIKIPK